MADQELRLQPEGVQTRPRRINLSRRDSIGSGVVFLGPGMEQFGTRGVEDPMGVHASVHIFVSEIDKHFAIAKASGATIMAEIMEMPWGDKLYVASDLEGQRWIFAEQVKS